ERRRRKRMRIDADVAGAAGTFGRSQLTDRLRDREDVRFVERMPQRRAAVPRSAESYALRRLARIGLERIVRGNEARNVDEDASRSRFSGKWMKTHPLPSSRNASA